MLNCPLLLATVLAVLSTGAAPVGGAASASHNRSLHQVKNAAPAQTQAEKVAVELKTDIAKLIEQYGDLLKDPWLRYAKTNIGRAEQSVKTLVAEQGLPNGAAINDFHYGLTAFARALDQLPAWSPGNSGWSDVKGTEKPELKQLKAMRKAIKKIQDKANGVPELQATERIRFSDSTTPAEAVAYGERVLVTIEHMLFEGTLEQITGGGIAKTTEVMKTPLANLRAAIEDLDSPGEAEQDPQERFSQSVAAIRVRIDEVRKACDELTRYLPWAEPRVKLVEPMLDALADNFKKLKLPKVP